MVTEMAGDMDEVKRRIECAEAELRVAKNELVRLESIKDRHPYVQRASRYLDSIACNHKTSSDGLTLIVEDGYIWNTKAFNEAVYPANSAVTGYKIRFFV